MDEYDYTNPTLSMTQDTNNREITNRTQQQQHEGLMAEEAQLGDIDNPVEGLFDLRKFPRFSYKEQ